MTQTLDLDPKTTISGLELRVGDTISVWWSPNRDTITGLRDYNGPLLDVLGAGPRIASFALNRTGMTIPPDSRYTLIARPGRRS